jgi:protein-L-isoaspartate(D-aspartate) O-methyltransferase
MLTSHLPRGGVHDPRVIEAMARVPREDFVPPALRARAYDDGPLPIGHGQTISQPAVVAWMTQLARPQQTDRVLEVGTGSGYQTAVLAPLVAEIFTVEIVPDLAAEARARLDALGVANVRYRVGDAFEGWPEEAPFDIILLAAAPLRLPRPLLAQLADSGRLVAPVGDRFCQELVVVTRVDGELRERREGLVAFVPMVGLASAE